jgi:hypothetical protein
LDQLAGLKLSDQIVTAVAVGSPLAMLRRLPAPPFGAHHHRTHFDQSQACAGVVTQQLITAIPIAIERLNGSAASPRA